MKTIVVYKSKSGFTQKYAEWIARELSADLFEASKVSIDILAAYDTVIYGGGLYAVGINGVKLITENLEKLKSKKVVVFATGATPPREEAINEVRDKNFTAAQQEQIRFFYLRGGFDYNKMRPFDRILITLLKWKIKGKKELTADERGILAACDKPADFTRKKNIDELISYINSLKS